MATATEVTSRSDAKDQFDPLDRLIVALDFPSATAALAFIGLVNLDRVVIEAFNNRLTQSMPAARGRRSFWRVLDFLGKLQPAGPSDLSQALRTFSIKSSGKGIVVLLSDFMDKGGYEDALRYLLARQMDIYAIQILSQDEIEPEIVGDLKLVDGMITGWHEPQASHLAMLEAIAGRAVLEASYGAALDEGYLWHEFGDSHLVLP